jgi:hypothetical protein
VTVTNGIASSSICPFDKTVVFQYPGETGLVEIPSAVDENTEVPKTL